MTRRTRRVTAITVALALGAGAWALRSKKGLPGIGSTTSANAAAADQIRFHTVTRGPLRVAITEEGKLRAATNNLIYPEVKGQIKITWLAPEGSTVKKGDPVARFDKKVFEDTLNTQKGELEGARRQLQVNEEAVKIQEASGRSAVALAETKLGEAEVALRTYRNLEAPKELNTIEKEMLEARGKLTEADQKAEEVREKIDAELFEEAQRATLEQEYATHAETARTTRATIEGLMQQRRIFRAYDYPQNMDAKQKAMDNAKLEVEKARIEARSALNQKAADVAKVGEQIRRLERQVADLEDQIAKCEIFAPADGLVLYGNAEQSDIYYGDGRQVRVGAEWYGGNTLLTIPDLSAFLIEVQLPEEYRGRVAPGARASITVEAVPGLTLVGKIEEIASLAKPRVPYDPSSPKVFATKIKPEGTDPRLVSGMTARVEIVTDELADVLTVPIECVLNVDGRTVCHIQSANGPDRREVKSGKSNDHVVEITDGLKEGEKVYAGNPLETESGG